MPAIIYDFKALGGTVRKLRLDDWWQPTKPEPERKAAEPRLDHNDVWRRYVERLS